MSDFRPTENGWVNVFPYGDYPVNYNGNRLIQRCDRTAARSMVLMFNSEARRPNFPGIMIDFDHFSDDAAKPSIAAGWILPGGLEDRNDGLFMKPRYTKSGRESIEGGDYRFVSPVWNPRECEHIDDDTIRPLRLDKVALTNQPNIRGSIPITNVARPTQQPAPKLIQHRAETTLGKFPRTMSLATAYSLAREDAQTRSIANRAAELQKNNPRLSLASAYCYAHRETTGKAAEVAAVAIEEIAARVCPALSPLVGLSFIRNRLPQLFKVINRQAGWEALSDLEPAAHAAYLEAVRLPPGDAAPRWRWEGLLDQMTDLALRNPDLGFEWRWQKLKESNPNYFWRFILSCVVEPGEPLVYSRSNPSDAAQQWIDSVRKAKARNG